VKLLQDCIVVKRSALQAALSGQELSARADARWWLSRQGEVELFKQDFLISFRMRVAA
jgi:hypothetical protein